jgi:hypothetical protein
MLTTILLLSNTFATYAVLCTMSTCEFRKVTCTTDPVCAFFIGGADGANAACAVINPMLTYSLAAPTDNATIAHVNSLCSTENAKKDMPIDLKHKPNSPNCQTWVDLFGAVTNSTPWAPGEPDCASSVDTCAFLKPDLTFSDIPCTTAYNGACIVCAKKLAVPLTTTTAASTLTTSKTVSTTASTTATSESKTSESSSSPTATATDVKSTTTKTASTTEHSADGTQQQTTQTTTTSATTVTSNAIAPSSSTDDNSVAVVESDDTTSIIGASVAAGVCCCVLLLFLLISLLRHKNKKQQEEEEHEQEEESSQQTSMYTMVDETPIAQDNIYGSTREIRNDVVYENMPSDTDTVTYSTMPQ